MTLLLHNFGAKLRAILGLESWDYCVIWRLSEDQRVLEWVDCCCAGAENIPNGEEPLLFPVSYTLACKDVVIQHPRTNSCDLLTDLPSIVPLGSGIHAQALLSNQATWINFSPNLDSAASEDRPNCNQETLGTRVLIPIPGGLVEFFVAKQVPEDPQVIEFITAQCSISLEQQSMILQSNPTNSRVNLDDGFHEDDAPYPAVENDQNDHIPHHGFNFTRKDDVVSVDPGLLCHSSTIFSQHHNHGSSDCTTGAGAGTGSNNGGMFFQGTHHELNPFNASIESGGTQGDTNLLQKRMTGNPFMHTMEPLEEDKEDQVNDNDSFKGRSNSMSESDANEDDEDPKYRRRTGKGTQCKNLEAERKRRKKLNERLYTLRSMVPKISKLDRASIIGDAIEFVKDLRKQVKDLQNELEEQSDDEDQSNNETSKNQPDRYHHNGMNFGYKSEREKISSRYHKGIAGNGGMDGPKQNHESQIIVDRVQQMEPQVEVAQLDGNEFFIRVFCEHKPGGFLRLMQALDSLGLEASSVNATRHTCLVSNIFKVERRDHEMLQADHVRDSLLELTRNPPQRMDWDD